MDLCKVTGPVNFFENLLRLYLLAMWYISVFSNRNIIWTKIKETHEVTVENQVDKGFCELSESLININSTTIHLLNHKAISNEHSE
ncbi:hypothetical protein Hanom_Chr14g01334461 [Helianthus anomalus]